MANSLIGWYNKFFRDCGIGNSNPEGSRKILFKKEMMVYSYKIKTKFFEESSIKIWRLKTAIDSNLSTAYRMIRNSYSPFWSFEWDLDSINWLEMELVDGKHLYVTIDTHINQAKFDVYFDDIGKEKCKIMEGVEVEPSEC